MGDEISMDPVDKHGFEALVLIVIIGIKLQSASLSPLHS
jgi:hypothetical protein